MENKIKHIIDCCNIHPGDSILDAGTGTGSLLPRLAEATGRFGRIDAVDINPEMLALAHRHHARLGLPVCFILSDIEDDPVHPLYDRIVLYKTLPHLRRPLDTIIRLYAHNLAGAGCLIIAEPTSRDKTNTLARKHELPGHMLPPAAELADRLRDHGLIVDYIQDDDNYYILRLRRH